MEGGRESERERKRERERGRERGGWGGEIIRVIDLIVNFSFFSVLNSLASLRWL